MKNKFIVVLLAVALFIPTFIAIGAYLNATDPSAPLKNVIAINIEDTAGQKFTLNKDNGGKEADRITQISDMIRRATKVDALPDQLSGTPAFQITLAERSKSSVYRCYFSDNADQAFCVSQEDGAVYHIAAAEARTFMQMEYAASVFPYASLPVLNIAEGTTVKPKTAAWSYKSNVSYIARDTSALTSKEVGDYNLEGGFVLNFSLEPDYLAVVVRNQATGETIFNDLYEHMENVTLPAGVQLAVDVEAKWYEDSSRTYYGESSYSFLTEVSAPAVFYLGQPEITVGEFVVISGKNVANAENVSFSSEPAIDYDPVFFSDGKYVHALVPIRYTLPGGNYTFTLKYGAVSQNMTLNVKAKTFATLPDYDVSATLLARRTEATLEAFERELSPYASSAATEKYFDGKFLSGVREVVTGDEGYFFGGGFGMHRTVTSGGQKIATFQHDGIDFVRLSNFDALAVNNGKVIYVGSTEYSGNIIVIDHGYGLKSWYSFLDKTSVAVGDMVNRGDVIGTVGQTGFTKVRALHMGITVFDVPVSPYSLWKDGVVMYDFK